MWGTMIRASLTGLSAVLLGGVLLVLSFIVLPPVDAARSTARVSSQPIPQLPRSGARASFPCDGNELPAPEAPPASTDTAVPSEFELTFHDGHFDLVQLVALTGPVVLIVGGAMVALLRVQKRRVSSEHE